MNGIAFCRFWNADFSFLSYCSQDIACRMDQHPVSREWKKYSYEWTVGRLQARFPQALVVLVKPVHFEEDCYSCFENFLACEQYGSPDFSQQAWGRAYDHLVALLEGLAVQVAIADQVSLDRCTR